MSARSPSASADPRYDELHVRRLPGHAISSFAAPNSRAKNGRVMLMPWMRSSRARRCVRNRMPLRTSTASWVMRNVCMRHDSQKPMTSATISSATPAIAHPTSPCVTMPPIGSFCQSPRHVSNSTSRSSPTSGAKITRNMSTSRSRRFAMTKPRIASSAMPPRSSGRRRVQPVPLAVGEVRDPRGAHGCAHSPALRVSARATSSSRSRSASSIGRPGIVTAVDAAAVTNFRSARPSARASGPRVMSTSCMRP